MKNIVKALPRAVVGGFVLILLAFISFDCVDMPLAPVAPMSDIKLEGVSIFDITKYFSELVGKSPGMTINADGTMSYIATQSSAPVKIDSMKMTMSPSSQLVGVGQFSIAGFSQSTNVAATSISPALNGTLPFLPAQSFTLAPVKLNDTVDFDYVRVASGTLILTITNNLPVPLDFPKQVVLRNRMGSDTNTIATFQIPALAANGGSTSVPRDVAGKLLRGLMTSDSIQLHTPGSSTPVVFSSGSTLSVTFQSVSFIADSASAKIPQQTLQSIRDSLVVLDDSVVVQNANFSAGSFQLQIVNNLGVDVSAIFVIKQLLKNGVPDTINRVLSAKTTLPLIYLANQYSIQPLVKPNGIGSQLTFSVGINTINSNGIKKTITKNDFVKASIIPGSPLVLKSITGKIKTQVLPINSAMASSIEFKDASKMSATSINFKGIGLTVKFPMTGGYPMDYDLTVIAKSKGTSVDSIKVKTGQNGFTRIYPDNPVITISNAPGFDNFLSKFFPVAPDSFYIRGSITLNPDFVNATNYSTYDSSKIYPSFVVNFPISVGITNGKVTDVIGFTKQEIPKDFTKSVGQGTLTFYFYNKFPFKLFFHANFLGNYNPQTHKGDTLLSIAPSDTIQPAAVDGNGFTTGPTFSRASFSFNSAQMVQFNNADSLYIRFDLSTSNNGQIVKVRGRDYIRVYAKGDITYTIGKQ